LKALHRTADTV